MSYQITKVDLIPNGEIVTCNVSQFDNGRVLPFEIYENGEVYNIPSGITVELHCRKPDGNIVTLPSDSINDNIVNFISTTQLTACYGKNVCEIALYGPDEYLIGSANFILDVEKSPTLGGITSTSEIHNLEEQIEEITTEIIGEDYYNKSEVNDLLSDKANAADVYTKSQVDSALDLKANAADVYTKSQVDSVLDLKANVADVYTKAETDAKIEEAIEEILPVDTAGPSAIANFTTGLALPLVNCSVGITATGGNGTPDNPNPINGYTEANITANGDTVTVAFGQTVYGGVLDVTRGKLTVTWANLTFAELSTKGWNLSGSGIFYLYPIATAMPDILLPIVNNPLCSSFAYQPSGTMENNTFRISDALYIKTDEAATAVDFKAWLANNTGSFAYELATPFDIDLTPEVISAVVGENNVYSDTNGDTTVQYKDSIQHYIDKHIGG